MPGPDEARITTDDLTAEEAVVAVEADEDLQDVLWGIEEGKYD